MLRNKKDDFRACKGLNGAAEFIEKIISGHDF